MLSDSAELDAAIRARVAVVTGLTVLGYVVLVYLVFFLTYTPLDIVHVRGVQVRYLVIVAARGRDPRRRSPKLEIAGWHERADRNCRGADLGCRHGHSSVAGPLGTWPSHS